MDELLKFSPSELKNMDKQTIHEGYKKILARMLMHFYIDCTNTDMKLETLGDLSEFIRMWIDKHIEPAHQEWNPGDCGK
jgi:hypothetical protein